MKELHELFPFEYKGGGYFRRKGVPEGVSAEMLHGMEAVEYLYAQMKALPSVPEGVKGES